MAKVWVQRWVDRDGLDEETGEVVDEGVSCHRSKKGLIAYYEACESDTTRRADGDPILWADAPAELWRLLGDFDYESMTDDDMAGDYVLALEGFLAAQDAKKGKKDAKKQSAAGGGQESSQLKRLGKALAVGGGMAVMDQTGEVLLDLARHFAKDVPFIESALKDPNGRELVKLMMAGLVHTAALQFDFVPKKEVVAAACEMQIQLAAFKLVGPNLALLREMATQLAKAGETIGESPVKALFAESTTEPAPKRNGRTAARDVA